MDRIKDKSLILEQRLEQLEQEHYDLNQIIDDQINQEDFDSMTLQRLKKRKLFVKDKISYLKSVICPDIIA